MISKFEHLYKKKKEGRFRSVLPHPRGGVTQCQGGKRSTVSVIISLLLCAREAIGGFIYAFYSQ